MILKTNCVLNINGTDYYIPNVYDRYYLYCGEKICKMTDKQLEQIYLGCPEHVGEIIVPYIMKAWKTWEER